MAYKLCSVMLLTLGTRSLTQSQYVADFTHCVLSINQVTCVSLYVHSQGIQPEIMHGTVDLGNL